MKTILETERFLFRELTPDDADGMFELDADPEVHRYLGNKPIQSREQAIATIEFICKQYTDNGIGRWAVEDKASGDFLGWAGLKLQQEPINNHTNYYDLGYRLLRKHWGKGVAFECAVASLKYGFDVLGVDAIYAAAHVENIASNKVLTKVGLTFIETFVYDGMTCNWYGFERKE
ncbi:MAG: GNAT family N-acetyltransferase [Flavobacteriales bacterium]|nr:GNAT family N-acetyltransferase [Flavobacteriales bacterium]MCB9448990.1 GNAT family N-acetyltransferase [Flavobacteriales bacterium]